MEWLCDHSDAFVCADVYFLPSEQTPNHIYIPTFFLTMRLFRNTIKIILHAALGLWGLNTELFQPARTRLLCAKKAR
jgi:hypothetical protein